MNKLLILGLILIILPYNIALIVHSGDVNLNQTFYHYNISTDGSLNTTGDKIGIDIINLSNQYGICFSNGTGQYVTITNFTAAETDPVAIHNNTLSLINLSNINNLFYVQPGNAADIQQKINLCPKDTCTVVIPPETYIITSEIQISNIRNFNLIGSGYSTIFSVDNNANLESIITFFNASYSSISHIFINGNNDTQSGGSGYGIVVNGTSRFRLDDLYITNTLNSSLVLVGDNSSFSSHAAEITNLRIYGSNNIGIDLRAFAYDTQLNNIWIAYPKTYGTYITSGAQFFNNLHIWNAGIDNVKIASVSQINRFSNCYIESSSGDGFDMYDADYNIISNCNIWNNTAKGIMAELGNRNIISNNRIKDNDIGIDFINGTSNILNSNVIDNNQYGLKGADSNYSIITSNQFVYNTYSFVIDRCNNCTVLSNQQFYNNNHPLPQSTYNSTWLSNDLDYNLMIQPTQINNTFNVTSKSYLFGGNISDNLSISYRQPTLTIADSSPDGTIGLGTTLSKIDFTSNDDSSSFPGVAARLSVVSENTFGSQYAMLFMPTVANATPATMLRINFSGIYSSGKVGSHSLSGTGNAPVGVDSAGTLFRDSTSSLVNATAIAAVNKSTSVANFNFTHPYINDKVCFNANCSNYANDTALIMGGLCFGNC